MGRRIPGGAKIYFGFLGGLAAVCALLAVLWFATAGAAGRETPRYLLKDNGGRLALYAADGGGPLAEYDIYTRLLPEQDVLSLQQGLPVRDESELQQKLEDYGL